MKLKLWKFEDKIYCYKNKYHLNPTPYWKYIKDIILNGVAR